MEVDKRKIIYEEREKGVSFSVIAEQLGISVTTVRKYYENEKRRREIKNNEIYIALCAVSDNSEKNMRVFNMLSRNGIDTVERFLSLSKDACRKFRDCGDVAYSIIRLAQDYIRNNQFSEDYTALEDTTSNRNDLISGIASMVYDRLSLIEKAGLVPQEKHAELEYHKQQMMEQIMNYGKEK